MTRVLRWSELRDEAIERFGGTPSAELEEEIASHFERRPRLVLEEIRRVGADLASGKVRAGWPILRARLASVEGGLVELVVADDSRERAERAAFRWVRAAGMHFDRWPEVELALFEEGFADRGQSLRAWADDDDLRRRAFDAWADARAAGEAVERDELDRARRWCGARERRMGAHGHTVTHPWLGRAAA